MKRSCTSTSGKLSRNALRVLLVAGTVVAGSSLGRAGAAVFRSAKHDAGGFCVTDSGRHDGGFAGVAVGLDLRVCRVRCAGDGSAYLGVVLLQRCSFPACSRPRFWPPFCISPTSCNAISCTAPLCREQNTELNSQIQAGGTKIRQARKAVERASAAKVEFLAAAGQDVRQPLFAMNLLLDTLRYSDDEAERQDAIDRVEESLHGLDATFESLLDISRMESSLLQSDVQSFHLRDVTTQLCSECEIIAAHEGLTFKSRVRDAVLRSDPRLVLRIVRHLVNNALQHTQQGGVSCSRHVCGPRRFA